MKSNFFTSNIWQQRIDSWGEWGANKVSSKIAPTLEIDFNTYMEEVSRQRQTVSPIIEV